MQVWKLYSRVLSYVLSQLKLIELAYCSNWIDLFCNSFIRLNESTHRIVHLMKFIHIMVIFHRNRPFKIFFIDLPYDNRTFLSINEIQCRLSVSYRTSYVNVRFKFISILNKIDLFSLTHTVDDNSLCFSPSFNKIGSTSLLYDHHLWCGVISFNICSYPVHRWYEMIFFYRHIQWVQSLVMWLVKCDMTTVKYWFKQSKDWSSWI